MCYYLKQEKFVFVGIRKIDLQEKGIVRQNVFGQKVWHLDKKNILTKSYQT